MAEEMRIPGRDVTEIVLEAPADERLLNRDADGVLHWGFGVNSEEIETNQVVDGARTFDGNARDLTIFRSIGGQIVGPAVYMQGSPDDPDTDLGLVYGVVLPPDHQEQPADGPAPYTIPVESGLPLSMGRRPGLAGPPALWLSPRLLRDDTPPGDTTKG